MITRDAYYNYRLAARRLTKVVPLERSGPVDGKHKTSFGALAAGTKVVTINITG